MAISLEFYLITTVFIFLCAYFSYRWGQNEGLSQGAEGCIDLLTKEGILEVQLGDDGQEYIFPVQYEEEN